ncbi:hypothetical protein P691DRAFT_705693 [Macrolepiota fuliginosa MF-IS2]|uniref:Uncharacterized protein n=1 Tax=Macrolepiota fuliginosa MF-IS2 TaxID=1400762 RepID=A0A9P6C148_9AGAR|nr:hypothetical protein P691DRAFT_705693 [Macrolepiota fuliginosa MF-IS2]
MINDLFPVSVDESERYKRGVKITKGVAEGFIIPYLTIDNPLPVVPSSWSRYVHPEGAVYFWDSDRRIVTDADILNPEIYETIENRLAQIQGYIREYHIDYPCKETVHLYLEHYPKIPAFGYYFVDHVNRTLFWLDAKYGYNMVRELQTAPPDLGHVGTELRSQYWYHNEYFPHVLHFPNDALVELQDILWHAVGDLLTSSDSTVPYTLGETKDMQALVTDIITYYRGGSVISIHKRGSTVGSGRLDDGARAVVCKIDRLLGLFTHERFINFYGEKCARLCHGQSVFEEAQRTWFVSLVSPIVFYAPESYLKKLQSMSVDSFVNNPSWDKLLTKLTDEWKEYTLYGTVLLTSNVSFLAIQSLDALGSHGYRNPAQRASYFSIAVSIGTIILGLLLVRQHHTTLHRDFLVNRSVTAIGLETLAVMYSLPYALLMYGMITFFLAFSIMCFQSKDKATIGILTFAWTSIVLLLLWCLSASYEYTVYETHWFGRKYRALRNAIGTRLKNRSVVSERLEPDSEKLKFSDTGCIR